VITAFDRIFLNEASGRRELTTDEFLRLPLYSRVRLILENRVEFSLAGRPVGSREALKELKTLLSEAKAR
jgi:hypothetical protein